MSVFEMLEREWARLAADQAVASRLPDVCRAAGGAAVLSEVERFVRRADAAAADRVLVVLVGRAVEGDELAARVLLQLLLPGVRRLARRWWALGDADERAAAAVAAVYARIRRYPLARRPERVASNVLMDAAADLRRAVGRRETASCPGLPAGWDPAASAPRHPALELVDALAEAVGRGLVSRDDAQLIAASRIAGTSLREIARRRGTALRTLQWRRQRAEAALAGTAA